MRAAPLHAEFKPFDPQLRDGRRVTVRTVRAEDKGKVQATLRGLSPESRYTRIMAALRELSSEHAQMY